MEVTLVGLQNAGKTSLLRVLAVSMAPRPRPLAPRSPANVSSFQGGEFTLE